MLKSCMRTAVANKARYHLRYLLSSHLSPHLSKFNDLIPFRGDVGRFKPKIFKKTNNFACEYQRKEKFKEPNAQRLKRDKHLSDNQYRAHDIEQYQNSHHSLHIS